MTNTFAKEADGAPVRKHRNLRRIIGIVLLVLVVVFGLITIITMRQRVEAADEMSRPILQRALMYDLIVVAGVLIVALGITFDVFTAVRNRVVRIIGYVVWGAGIAIVAEALLMSGSVIIGNMNRKAPAETRYVMVVGSALAEDNSIPGELNARLRTAGNWWKDHPDTTVIVTGSGKASKKKNTSLAGLSIVGSPVDTIGASLTARSVPEDSVLKVGRSDSPEQGFENLLKQDGIGTDTPIVLIVDPYDMGKTARIAEEAGFTSVSTLPADSNIWSFGTNVLWDVWNRYDPDLKPAEDAAA